MLRSNTCGLAWVGLVAWLVGALPARGVEVPFTEWVISNSADGAASVFATDLDRDEDTDILSASFFDDKIVWYESDGGSPPTFTERVISNSANGARSVFAADLDGDLDIDVLSASSNDDKIAWYENDGGSPPTFTERVISTAANGAFSVFATDLDGDGDVDVLSASFSDDKIAWYENDGGSPPSFTERVISTTADQGVSVFATDVNGDGDIDVLSASQRDDKIAWYENDGGSPPMFTERVISTTADLAGSVFAADLDGDGDTDVLSASRFDDKIAWYENGGGLLPVFTERVISNTADFAASVFATDVNSDGDIDVLSASGNKIAWYESDGLSPPSFTERVISTAAIGAGSVFATDVDGDGDIDVLSGSLSADRVTWYENAPALAPPPPPSAQGCRQLGITVPPGFECEVFATGVRRAFGIAVAPPASACAGDVFVASNLAGSLGEGRIWRVVSPGAVCPGPDCVDFLGSGIDWPDGLAFDAEGNLFVGQSGGGAFSASEPCKIVKIPTDMSCGNPQVDTFANIFDADGLAVDIEGHLLVASGRSNAGVLDVDPGGSAACPCVCRTCESCADCDFCDRVASTLPFFSNPNAVVVNTQGDIFSVGSGAIGPVVKIDPSATPVEAIEFATNVGASSALAMRSDDMLFVGDVVSGTIYMLDSTIQMLPIAAGPGDVFATGFGASIASLAVDSAGALYIGRESNWDIVRIFPCGADAVDCSGVTVHAANDPPEEHCVDNPTGESDFVPDRRPVRAINLLHLFADQSAPPVVEGSSPWWFDDNDDGDVRSDSRGRFPLFDDNDILDSFDELLRQLDELYCDGWRRFVFYLPAGDLIDVLNGINFLASAQYWTMPQWKRNGLEMFLKPWIDDHRDETDPDNDIRMGVYAGYRIDDPCSLGMVDSNRPDTTVAADMCVVKQNLKPWIDLGFEEMWFDAAGGACNGDIPTLVRMGQAPEYKNIMRLGGEGIPITDCTECENSTGRTRSEFDPEWIDRAPWLALQWFFECFWQGFGSAFGGEMWTIPPEAEVGVWFISTPQGREDPSCNVNEQEINTAIIREYLDHGFVPWSSQCIVDQWVKDAYFGRPGAPNFGVAFGSNDCLIDDDCDIRLEDGDHSGIIGDSPCLDRQTIDCDDNCPLVPNTFQEDGDGDGIGDACDPTDEHSIAAGETVNITPMGDSDDLTEQASALFTNNSVQKGQVAVTLSDTATNPPNGVFALFGQTLDIVTDLADGIFQMTVTIPFTEANLINAGFTAGDLDQVNLGFFNDSTDPTMPGSWELAVVGNCVNPPICNAGALGDRSQIVDIVTLPPPSNILGDYGVFFNTVTRAGYMFAVVDHTTEFSPGAGFNQPPECDAGGPYVAECQGTTTTVAVDGSGSSDSDMDPLMFLWTTDCPGGVFDDAMSATPVLTVETASPCPLECNVFLSVDDGRGGLDSCDATVTISDTTDPLLVGVPGDATVECDSVPAPASVTATDNCDPNPNVLFDEVREDGLCEDTFTLTRTWTATDSCGHSGAASQTIMVEDTTDPVIGECPSDIFIDCAPNPGVEVTFGDPTATDNCDAKPTVTCDPPSGSLFPTGLKAADGTTEVTCTAEDNCGNSDSCSFEVTLVACGACCNFDGHCEDDVRHNTCLETGGINPVWFKDSDCKDIGCQAIPTVSEWALIVMTLLGCTAGTVLFGRRRRVSA